MTGGSHSRTIRKLNIRTVTTCPYRGAHRTALLRTPSLTFNSPQMTRAKTKSLCLCKICVVWSIKINLVRCATAHRTKLIYKSKSGLHLLNDFIFYLFCINYSVETIFWFLFRPKRRISALFRFRLPSHRNRNYIRGVSGCDRICAV